jgi:hypothetical protein
VEIKSRKSKSEILMFAKLSAEKRSSDYCHAIERAKSKRIEEMDLSLFFLYLVCRGKKS